LQIGKQPETVFLHFSVSRAGCPVVAKPPLHSAINSAIGAASA